MSRSLVATVQLRRAEEQSARELELPEPAHPERRYCACGCGVWWVEEGRRRAGRPLEYLNPVHRHYAFTVRDRARARARRLRGGA